MTRLTKTLSVIAMLVMPMAAQAQQGPPGMPARDPNPVVQYRKDVMQSLQAQSAALRAVVDKQVPYEANIALHAQTISLLAQQALKGFETKAPGGTAKPEVWDNWKDFSDKLKTLDTAATNVAKKGVSASAEDLQAVTGACGGCHRTYKERAAPAAAPPK